MNAPAFCDVVLSPGEPLPSVDAWLVVDVLRATTTLTTFLERGGLRVLPVADLDEAMSQARHRGAKVMVEPETHHHGGGTLRFAAIKGVGDVLNYLVERSGELGGFWPDLKPDPGLPLCEPGLVRADHLTNNVGPGQLDDLVGFYERVFGFAVTRTFDIRGQLGTGLRSKVVQSANSRVIIPINEPTDPKSQIQEFVKRHQGCGVQHIAMSTNNIMETIRILQAQGINFLRVPATYYELRKAKADIEDEIRTYGGAAASKSTLAQHRRGDGRRAQAFLDRLAEEQADDDQGVAQKCGQDGGPQHGLIGLDVEDVDHGHQREASG